VVKNEAAKAPDFNRIHQALAARPQLVQQQSLRNNRILQISISLGIWFGTRGSEVQILSPRPIFSVGHVVVASPVGAIVVVVCVVTALQSTPLVEPSNAFRLRSRRTIQPGSHQEESGERTSHRWSNSCELRLPEIDLAPPDCRVREVYLGCVLIDVFDENGTTLEAISQEPEPEISVLPRSSEGAPSAANRREV
jgi:hypothetical protein